MGEWKVTIDAETYADHVTSELYTPEGRYVARIWESADAERIVEALNATRQEAHVEAAVRLAEIVEVYSYPYGDGSLMFACPACLSTCHEDDDKDGELSGWHHSDCALLAYRTSRPTQSPDSTSAEPPTATACATCSDEWEPGVPVRAGQADNTNIAHEPCPECGRRPAPEGA